MEKMKKCEKVFNIIGTCLTLVYALMFFFYTTRACLEKPDHFSLGPINNVATGMFVILGVTFFTVGVAMNLSLKWHFPNFYTQYRCLLWLATILLTCPLFIRAVKDHLYYHNEAFGVYFDDHFVIDNTVYALLSTVLPITTQTCSLIFGFMRQQENLKSKNKKANKHSILGLTGGSGGIEKKDDTTEAMSDESDDTSDNGAG